MLTKLVARVAAIATAVLTALTAVVCVAVPVAVADKGLDVTSTYTYTIDAETDAVRVQADLTFTNTVPNRTEGNYINKTYFNSFTLPIPKNTGAIFATQDGAPLTVTPRELPESETFGLINIDFAKNLFYQKTVHVQITYNIVGSAPRTPFDPSRVNDAYAAFNAYGIADEGKLTIRVVVPGSYQIDTFGSTATRTEENGAIVYTATGIDQPNEFDLFISARNDSALATTTVTQGSHSFVLRGWPGDADWEAFITGQINAGVPKLEELIGQMWPVAGSLEVREAFTPYLYGYAGWFDDSTRELEIGEELDSQVMLHELSHAWFNDKWFVDRWIDEGMAQTYSALADEALGQPAQNPKPAKSAVVDPAAIPLNGWGDPNLSGDGADATEEYGYNSAWFVIDSIVDEIGVDAMRKVFTATHDAKIAYRGNGEPEAGNPRTDWQRFIDLVDEVGGSTKADALIQKFVLTTDQLAKFDRRGRSRVQYDGLQTRSADWAVPLVIRRSMESWDFDGADRLMGEATGVLDSYATLGAKAGSMQLKVPGDVKVAYEAADVDLHSAQKLVDDRMTTLIAIDAAVARMAEKPSLLDKVGLIGTNVQPLLDESRAAFEKGDNAIARSRAAQLIETLDGRRSVGQSRVLRTSLGVGGFLFLLIVLVVLRRRTKRRRRLAEQIQTEQTLVTGPEPALVTGPEPGLRGENWPAPQP